MKKTTLIVLSMIMLFTTCWAQKGNNQISIGAEVGIPTGDFGDLYNTGLGGFIKGLHGVGQSGQVSFTSGKYWIYIIEWTGC